MNNFSDRVKGLKKLKPAKQNELVNCYFYNRPVSAPVEDYSQPEALSHLYSDLNSCFFRTTFWTNDHSDTIWVHLMPRHGHDIEDDQVDLYFEVELANKDYLKTMAQVVVITAIIAGQEGFVFQS